MSGGLTATLRAHATRMGWPSLRDAADMIERQDALVKALTTALECLLPGLVLDLRYAGADDDKDAMLSRIDTVIAALEKAHEHVTSCASTGPVTER